MNKREQKRLIKFANAMMEVLRIGPWDITIDVCDDPPKWVLEENVSEADGMIKITDPARARAEIWTRLTSRSENSQAPEEIIIHELLHLAIMIAGLDNEDQDWRTEQFIHTIAPMLLEAAEGWAK